MSAETRGLSRVIVGLCGRYPLLALLFVPIAGYVAYDYLVEARFVKSAGENPALTMKVDRVFNEVNRPIFPKYRAAGQTSVGPTVVEISKQEFRRLKAGDSLEIHATNSKARPYLTQKYVEWTVSSIRFSLGGFPVTDNAIFFGIVGIMALVWAMFDRQIAASFAEPKPQTQQSERQPAKLNWPGQVE